MEWVNEKEKRIGFMWMDDMSIDGDDVDEWESEDDERYIEKIEGVGIEWLKMEDCENVNWWVMKD